jgi:hypothetical protein
VTEATGVIWRPVLNRAVARYVQNISAGGTAYMMVKYPAVVNKGMQLLGYGGIWQSDIPPIISDEVWVIFDTGSGAIATGEW